MDVYKLTNSMINSHWGCLSSMTELFGYINKDGKPMAELWMGAHPKLPSSIKVEGHDIKLNDFIALQPIMMLGKKTAKCFAERLPFLFKVLSAKTPLSIQSHPSKSQAEQGWARENALKIPLDSLKRNYKDDNHKPELVYALTPYHALNGFRPIEEIITLWQSLSLNNPIISHALQAFSNNPSSDGLQVFYKEIMTSRSSERLVQSVVLACQNLLVSKNLTDTQRLAFQLVLELEAYYPNDIGALSGILLNNIVLQPGEAMYLTSGTLHAYLKGTALELMANSDNVLRGGLTPKHVDVDELMNTIHFKSLPLSQLKCVAKQKSNETQEYQPPIPDFKLTITTLNVTNKLALFNSESANIIFVIEGTVDVVGEHKQHIQLKRGESCFIPASITKYQVRGVGKFATASSGLPISN